MHERLFKTGRTLAIVILFVLSVAHGIHAIDPYKYAENKMTEVISKNPGFLNDLSVYGNEANRWRDTIQVEVFLAKSILSAFDTIKSTGVWNVFLGIADRIPEGRLLVLGIEKLAISILDLDRTLFEISLSIEKSYGFSQLVEPGYLSKEEIRMIFENEAELEEGLVKTRNALDACSAIVREVFNNPQLSNFTSQVESWRRNPIDVIAAFADTIYQALISWRELPNILDNLSNTIAKDMETLNQTSSWYIKAEMWDKTLDIVPIRPLANWVIDWNNVFILVLSMSTGSALLGWVGPSSILQVHWPVLPRLRTKVADNHTEPYRPVLLPKKLGLPEKSAIIHIGNHSNPLQTIPFRPQNNTEVSLLCSWRNGKQECLALPVTGKVTIGGSTMDDIHTDPSRTGMFQAFIKKARANYYIEVLDTAYPTRMNGSLIKCARVLKPGDTIAVGDLLMTVMKRQQW